MDIIIEKINYFDSGISAGFPSPAADFLSSELNIHDYIITNPSSTFCVKVSGDSMIGAGILDGDTAIIKKADDAYSGEIIVALIDGEEATLKRLRKKGETIALEPANSAYETKIYGPDRVQVQGTLVGILRSYWFINLFTWIIVYFPKELKSYKSLEFN